MKTKLTRRDALLTGPLAAVAAFFGIKAKPVEAKSEFIGLGRFRPHHSRWPKMLHPQDQLFITTLGKMVACFAKCIVMRCPYFDTLPRDASQTLRDIRFTLLQSFEWEQVAPHQSETYFLKITERELKNKIEEQFLSSSTSCVIDFGPGIESKNLIWSAAREIRKDGIFIIPF